MSTATATAVLPANPTARAFAAMGRLTAGSAFSGLPALAWNFDSNWGITGTAHGSDDDVRRLVGLWAGALRVLPDGEPAEVRIEDGTPVSYPGYLVAHQTYRGVPITVGGTLHDVRELAW